MTQNRKKQCFKTSSNIRGDLRPPSAFLCSNFRRSSDFCGDLKQPRAIFCNLRTSYYQIGLLTTQVARSPRQFLTPQQFLANSDRQGIFLTFLVGELLPHGGGTGQRMPGEPLGRMWGNRWPAVPERIPYTESKNPFRQAWLGKDRLGKMESCGKATHIAATYSFHVRKAFAVCFALAMSTCTRGGCKEAVLTLNKI